MLSGSIKGRAEQRKKKGGGRKKTRGKTQRAGDRKPKENSRA
jgi:hypothetical protein